MKKISVCGAILLALFATSSFADVIVGENGDVRVNGTGSAVNVGDVQVVGAGEDVKVRDKVASTKKSQDKNQKRMAAPVADTGSVFVIDGADETVTHECNGQSVKIDGASNTVHLMGYCPKVSIDGANNQVEVDQTSKIQIDGAANQVVWYQKVSNKAPRVISSGAGNRVSRGSH